MGKKLGLQYSLRENPFQENGKFIANTLTRSNLGLEEIVTKMSEKGTTLTEVDIRAVIVLFRNEIIEALSDGNGVNIDNFFSVKASISGVFESIHDGFESDRHSLNLNMIAGAKFVADFGAKTRIEKIKKAKKLPEIVTVFDGKSESLNRNVTVNSLVRLEGDNLAFDKTADDEGIYLYSEDGKNSIKVKYSDTIRNKELRFVLPQEATTLGEIIYIEVRTRLKTKILKKGVTDFMLNLKTEPPQPVTP